MSKKSPTVSVTIVIPVKNEEGNIIKTLQWIKKSVKVPYNVIVVDGCSTDNTVSLVKKYSKKNNNVRVIETTPETSGFKDSVCKGTSSTKTEYVVVVMGDICDDPDTINFMYEKMKEGYDVVVGSRYMPGGNKIGVPKIQGTISKSLNKILYYVTDIPTHDITNPFKMYRTKLLNKVEIKSNANEFPIEVIYKLCFRGAKITEVPTVWRGRKVGKSKFNMIKVIPGYAKLCTWVLFSSWKHKLRKM